MQLIAYGAQDTYLSGDPQTTFFKTISRRRESAMRENYDEQPWTELCDTTYCVGPKVNEEYNDIANIEMSVINEKDDDLDFVFTISL